MRDVDASEFGLEQGFVQTARQGLMAWEKPVLVRIDANEAEANTGVTFDHIGSSYS